jgi:amino acid adenylation domain-containing protein
MNNEDEPLSSHLQSEDQELDQIWEWNASDPLEITKCMHEYFLDHAREYPDAPAVHAWDGSLTYHELQVLSLQLARYLASLGVGHGSTIPLCFEKSMWTVVGVLGAMRTGATFTLMDPSQPATRLKAIVEQTGAKVIITSDLQEELGDQIKHGAVVVNVSRNSLEQYHQTTPESTTLPFVETSSPMYLQFTSGSTGQPKGIIISHTSYASGAIPRGERVGYHSGSRCLDFPSYAFDVSIDCMMCSLASGGCICVPSEDDRMNDLEGAIKRLNANMVHVTPSIARLLSPEVMEMVEVLGLGGELVTPRDVAAWSTTCKLVIAYGPSETTVACTINDVVSTDCTGIGKGCGGNPWIVDPDDHNKLAPLGAVGELLIEGPIVGEGYLDQPEKTAEVFIKDPDWLVSGHGEHEGRRGKLYKTGDLVKYSAQGTGTLEFVGRKDQQVKLRGQRLELEEVEHHIRKWLPATVHVVAEVLKPEGSGEPTLVAFLAESTVTSTHETDIVPFSESLLASARRVNKELPEEVPRFMVPTTYIPLAKIPKLVSLKTDRKKLREICAQISLKELRELRVSLSEQGNTTEDSLITPQPSIPEASRNMQFEHKLSNAWRRVLGTDVEITERDTFFSLGGDSLRAMRLVAAARAEGISLTVGDIFGNPDLASMAITARPVNAAAAIEVPNFSLVDSQSVDRIRAEAAKYCGIESSVVEDLYPCTPLQEGLMALSAKVTDAYVAQRVVDLPDIERATRLCKAFETVAATSYILRTRIVQVPGVGLLQVVVGREIGFLPATELDPFLKKDQDNIMGLGTPLVRFAVINDPSKPTAQFVLTIHHALYDGWSMPLIVERVNKIYHSQTISEPVGFKSFIQFLSQQDRESSNTFWSAHLKGADNTQFPRLPSKEYQTQADSLLEHYVTIPKQSSFSTTTVATAIRGAWALISSRYTAYNDVVFGETLTGRNAPVVGVELIEGPMITTIPVRTKIRVDQSVLGYLQGIQDLSVQRIPYEHAGLQNIRRLSSDAREACELRTGLVLHPKSDDADMAGLTVGPADGFVMANDAEAAREALKFNTYALMLVFTLDDSGFLIMASFDSNCISSVHMESVLKQFDNVMQQLCNGERQRVGEITYLNLNDAEIISKQCEGNEPKFTEVSTAFRDSDFESTSENSSLTDGTKSDEVDSGVATPPKLTEKQQALAKLWGRILDYDYERLYLHSDFFELGGDSISAMKLVSEARLENMQLNVGQIFKHRTLGRMSESTVLSEAPKLEPPKSAPFAALDDVLAPSRFIKETVRPQLENQEWQIVDIYPARPLQTAAIDGTIQIPRFSVRYELVYFESPINAQHLRKSCQKLVSLNEILRTVFVKAGDQYFCVALANMIAAFSAHHIEGNLEDYVRGLCKIDAQIVQKLGSPFIAFHLVQTENDRSCLIIKISHAQYDEVCLPNLLQQLAALYENRPVTESSPFSTFVKHVVKENIPRCIQYWKDLLHGSTMTRLCPDLPIMSTKHVAVIKEYDISARSRATTIATLPTAAWAICLAKQLSIKDVVFGEVVTGRNTGLPNADTIIGPCWQYVPFRVKFTEGMTMLDLLNLVQEQHVATSEFEGIGLPEIMRHCTDWPESVSWFDTVVHQDVEHVETLMFETAKSRMETFYPHEEPLREIKMQAFISGNTMAIEIVTIESWLEYAHTLLQSIGEILEVLVNNPNATIQI